MVSFERLSGMYTGRTATSYERERRDRKWFAEAQSMQELLEHVRPGSRMLDIPIGTARFLPYYKARNFDVYGIDVSPDMIEQARATADRVGANIRLDLGDIRSIHFDDNYFDLVVCIRFLNLIEWEQVRKVLPELARVSRGNVLFGIRYVTSYSELRFRPADLVRLMALLLGVVRFRSPRRRALVHDRKALDQLLVDAGLDVLHTSYVQRRWDGTDYVMLLCGKKGQAVE